MSGIAFVVCFALAIALFGSGAGREPAGIAAYYASHGDLIRQIAEFYVLAIGVLFFLWFAAVLRDELEAPLVLVAGTLTGTLLLAADALWAATAITAQHEHPFLLNPNTHLIVEDAGFALFVAAASAAVLRTRVLPRIFGLIGFPIAASLAAAWYYLPVFGLLAWAGVASMLLAVRD
jgi:hypothetical protein